MVSCLALDMIKEGWGRGGMVIVYPSQPAQSCLHSLIHRCNCTATAVAAASISMCMPDWTKVQIKHLLLDRPLCQADSLQWHSCRDRVSGLSSKFGLQILFSFNGL